jgi:hypothetical protein
VRKRAGAFTHINNTYTQQGNLDSVYNAVRNKKSRHSTTTQLEDENSNFSIECDCGYLDALDPIIADIEQRIKREAPVHNRKAYDQLRTMPGCGEMLALTILYETHDISRFATVQDYSSYCRVVRAEHRSCGKNKAGMHATSKIGNPHLKWAFSEIAMHAVKNYPNIKKYHERQKRKYGRRGSMARLEHKFAVAVYYMLTKGTVFDEKRFLGN